MYTIKLKPLLFSLIISFGVGGLAGFLTSNAREVYDDLVKPAFSPPGIVFPIVWSLIFLLLGISSYIIYQSDSPDRKRALDIYALQLLLQFVWPLLFFGMEQYLVAFIWIILLWVVIIIMTVSFYRISPVAGYLLIPYLLWVTYAAYLNLSVVLLN